MAQDFLSDSELYFSTTILENNVVLDGGEAAHVSRVMRHVPGDKLYVTNGQGEIFQCEITDVQKNIVQLKIVSTSRYKNILKNIQICIPRIKVQDRLEFAIEKVVELGFTDIIIYESDRAIGKKDKTERWEKIALAAMKQSLRAFLPEISYSKNIFQDSEDKNTILFDQNADKTIPEYFADNKIGNDEKIRLIVGPEGGFSEKEYQLSFNYMKIKLSNYRLRSETAVITAASVISQNLM